MGNRSSSNQYGQWTPAGYLDTKRGLPSGVLVEPYIPHVHRSMTNLHEIHYQTSPRDFGSRLSLNHVPRETPFYPAPPPDTKTLKKLEKMRKKHEKIIKKLANKSPPPQPPPNTIGYMVYPTPAQMYQHHHMQQRAMSFDDLQRAQLDMAEMRLREEWRKAHPKRRTVIEHPNKSTVSSHSTCLRGGSLSSSSPVTSSSEERTTEHWSSSSRQRDSLISPPLLSSTPTHKPPPQPSQHHTIQVKVVGRSEKTLTENTYAQPSIVRDRASLNSTTSMTTSQLRGDQSEIDFSWVSEEEDRLKTEKTSKPSKPLPECYFGLEPRLESIRNSSTSDKTNVKQAASLFEEEARRIRLLKENTNVKEPLPDYNRPVERRLNRISASPIRQEPDQKRWRSSIAF